MNNISVIRNKLKYFISEIKVVQKVLPLDPL